MKLVTRAVAAGLCIASMTATSAMAATVSLSNITAVWSNPIEPSPGGVPVFLGAQGDIASARWGTPFYDENDPRSGYDFDGEGNVNFVVDPLTDPVSDDKLVGNFTHFNQPIESGTSITSIKLTVFADITVDAAFQGLRSFVFDFSHFETPNNAAPCANPSADNSKGCADRVRVSFGGASENFSVGGVDYTLLITGFQASPGGTLLSEFWTKEEANNVAGLYAVVTSRTDADSTVPVPAALPLLLSGLAGLGFIGRRRRNKTA